MSLWIKEREGATCSFARYTSSLKPASALAGLETLAPMAYARAEGPAVPGMPGSIGVAVRVFTRITPKANTARSTHRI